MMPSTAASARDSHPAALYEIGWTIQKSMPLAQIQVIDLEKSNQTVVGIPCKS